MSNLLCTDKNKLKELICFAVPAIVESLLVMLLLTVDTFLVSKIGIAAVASVALTNQPVKLLLVFFTGVNTAITKHVAGMVGREDRDGANAIARYGLILTIVVSVLIAIVAFALANQIMKLSGSNADTHHDAVAFFRIIIIGIIPSNISLYINAVKRGCQNSRVSMTSNIIANIVNVAFDFILIFGLLGMAPLGVVGAAIATDLGYLSAMTVSILSLRNKTDYVHLDGIIHPKAPLDISEKKPFLSMSITLFVEFLGTRIGFMLISAMTARIGTAALALDKVAMNCLDIVFSFGSGLQAAAITMVGRSVGKMDKKEAADYAKISLELTYIVAIFVALFFALFGDDMIGLFFEDAPELQEKESMLAKICALIVMVQLPQIVLNGILKGYGKKKYSLISAFVSVLLVMTGLTYVFIYVLELGLKGKWLSTFIAQSLWFLLLAIRFCVIAKKED